MKTNPLILDALASSVILEPMQEVWIAIRSDSVPGDGCRLNPYRANTAAEFDFIMSDILGLRTNIKINLGPGLFRTKGSQAWTIGKGWTICGQGMFNTVLRFELEPTASDPYGENAIVGEGVSGCCVSDLTIDCNLGKQKKFAGQDYAKVCPNAMRIVGRNNRAQRVRVINFGTTATNNEGFPLQRRRLGRYRIRIFRRSQVIRALGLRWSGIISRIVRMEAAADQAARAGLMEEAVEAEAAPAACCCSSITLRPLAQRR